jgi:hypothetical protein
MSANQFRDFLRDNSRGHMVPLVTDERFSQYGRGALDANVGLRTALREDALARGQRVDPRFRDATAFYDDHAGSTTRAFSILNEAERNAGRLLNPGNYNLIRHYYRRRPTERSQQPRSETPFLGRSSESPTYLGGPRRTLGIYVDSPDGLAQMYTGNSAGTTRLPEGEAFDMSSFLGRQSSPVESGIFAMGGPAPSPISPFNLDSFLGRSAPVPTSTTGVAESVSGMMGGGLVGGRTPFRKGGAMDRMVSEMTRNISSR